MEWFDLYRKYLYKIIEILGAFLIFIAICSVLNYMYVPHTNWNRILWHNFYLDKGKIENLYLGSSHVYADINPMQLDTINGKYNFNLSSPALRLNGAYHLLKEADKYNALSHVYLEVYYKQYVTVSNSEIDAIDLSPHWNWENTDYMKHSFNKLSYMFSISGSEKYVDVFLPFSRYRANLDNWEYIRQTVRQKRNLPIILYEYHNENEEGIMDYMPQGYQCYTKELLDAERLYCQDQILNHNKLGEKSKKYLRKIITYCQNRDIPITLFASPMVALELISTKDYDNYISQIREIAEEYNVEYYDFNLVKEEYLPVQNGKYFYDISHLNAAGGNMFTEFFSTVVESSSVENKKYFYSSYAEKLCAEKPAIYGLYYYDSGQECTYHIASNRESGMEYRITLTSALGESGGGTKQLVIQEYSENKEFTLSKDEHGSCTVEARMSGEEKVIQTLIVNY